MMPTPEKTNACLFGRTQLTTLPVVSTAEGRLVHLFCEIEYTSVGLLASLNLRTPKSKLPLPLSEWNPLSEFIVERNPQRPYWLIEKKSLEQI